MQMRNRTPTTASPRLRTPMGGSIYKDKPGQPGGKMDMKNVAIGGLLLLLGIVFFMNNGSSQQPMAVTMNPNTVRKVQQAVPDVKADANNAAGHDVAAEHAANKAILKDEARKAAQEHHEQEQLNIQEAHEKVLDMKGIKGVKASDNIAQPGIPAKGAKAAAPKLKDKKGRDKVVVRDADGDIVQDDMLARDIAAGRDVDVKPKEEEETDVAVGENRWDNQSNMPKWMKEYFSWHKQTTDKLSKENWRDQRYIVMTCLGGEICGNVAHRLRPLMAILRVAADSKRVFYIHWDLPDRLEKYLHPPQHGGIDWIVPEFVMWKVRKSGHVNDMRIIDQQAFQDDRRVVNVMFNDDTFGEPYYNERRKDDEKAASEAFHDAWNVLFKPSFMLTERIGESLRLMGLKPGEYATAHIDYETVPKNEAEQEELRIKVENAMNCMSQLRPGGPYLVAAQTYAIAREAIVYGKQHNVKVHAKQIAHDTSTVPTDLFTSFVEILLMADSRCVAYNRGGYGQLGYILGYDYNCRVQYGQVGKECTWKDPDAATEEQAKEDHHDDPDK